MYRKMASSTTSVVAKVNELKESLSKEFQSDNGKDSERCLDMIQRLDECDVNIQVLSETLIGTVVSKFKSNEDAQVAAAAKALVKKWKQLAKQSGVSKASPSSKSSSSDTNTATTTSTSNSNTAATAAETEFQNLPPLRKNIAMKLHQIFILSKSSLLQSGIHKTALSSLCTSRASEVEEAVHNQSQATKAGDSKSAYTNKIRSLVFNLKKNASLRENVILGSTSPQILVTMSTDQLATAEKYKQRTELVANLQDSRRLDWDQANESKINEMCGIKGDLLKASLFTCGRCKSTKTTSTQKQTRSADEPMTVFVFCLNCGNRWKC